MSTFLQDTMRRRLHKRPVVLLVSAAVLAVALAASGARSAGEARAGAEKHEGTEARGRVRPNFVLSPGLPLVRDEPGERPAWTWGHIATLMLAGAVTIAGLVWYQRRSQAHGVAPRGSLREWLGGDSASGSLRVVESKHLAGRMSLHVVRWGERELLLGCSGDGIRVLDRLRRTAGDAEKRRSGAAQGGAEDTGSHGGAAG